MKKMLLGLTAVLVTIVLLSGCASTGSRTGDGAIIGGTTGAMVGAAVGAAAGAILGHPAKGAAVGAVVGGALGGIKGASDAQREQEHRPVRPLPPAQPQTPQGNNQNEQYLPAGVVELHSDIAQAIRGKTVSVTEKGHGYGYGSQANNAKGVIQDAARAAGAKVMTRGKGEIEFRATITQESSGYGHEYDSVVRTVPTGPTYRLKVEVEVIDQEGTLLWRGQGSRTFHGQSQISRSQAIEEAARKALRNLY